MSIPGKPSSFWLEETPKEKFPSLKKDLTVDVAIIGGGIDNFGREKAGPAGEKPICTHMGCVVSWNSAEKSWDCPCHGSRFDHEGKVIHAPAIKDLEKIKS